MPKIINFADGNFIEFSEDSQEIRFRLSGHQETFNLQGKPEFRNQTGELVIELSGLACDDKNENRSWAIAHYAKDGYSELHFHNDRTEKYYVTAGTALVILNGGAYFLSRGDSIEVPKGQQHQVISVGEENLELLVLCTPSWVFEDQHFVNNTDEKKKNILTHESAIEAREQFIKHHPAGTDDNIAPLFYEAISEKFNFREFARNRKIAFIVVAHRVHTLPYFLESVSNLGPIAAIIPKASRCVPAVIESLENIYDAIWYDEINKETLKNNPEKIENFFVELIRAYPDYQFMILDHGGYFASQLNLFIKLGRKIAGVIEHTWNGEIKYAERKIKDLSFPLLSIARTRLKAREDDYVADSIVTTLKSQICGAAGINQDFEQIQVIGIVGYGHIGREVARKIRYETRNRVPIKIFDTSDEALQRAESDGFMRASSNEIIETSDLIITATSTIALRPEQFAAMKNHAVIACVTSSDDQFSDQAFKDFEPLYETRAAVKVYQHKQTNRRIYIAANGGSVNFLMGSTPHPILHAVLASVCVSAMRSVTSRDFTLPDESSIPSVTEKDLDEIRLIYQEYYGSSVSQTELFGVPSTYDRPFFGRTLELQKLSKGLYRHGLGVISQSITGIGGIGKTALAKAYIQQCMKDERIYDYIIFINASTSQSLYQSFINLAKQLDILESDKLRPTALIQEIYKRLKVYSQILIIFDDAANNEELEQAYISDEVVNFLPPKIDGQITHHIITTQNSHYQTNEVIQLGPLDQRSAIALIKEYCINSPQNCTNADALLLAETLKFYPLALSQAVAYLKTHPEISIVDYIKLLQQSRVIDEAFLKQNNLSDHQTIYATLDLTLNKINHDALQLLNMLAYLSNEKIPLEFVEYVIKENFKTHNVLDVLKHLEKYCLVDIEVHQNNNSFVRMHPLLQNFVRQKQIQKNIHTENLRRALLSVNNYINNLGFNFEREFFPFIPHAISVIDLHESYLENENCLEKFKLLLLIANYQHFNLLFSDQAEASYQKAEIIFKRQEQLGRSLIEYHVELSLGLANSAAAKGDPFKYVAVLNELMESNELTATHILRALKGRGIILNIELLNQVKIILPRILTQFIPQEFQFFLPMILPQIQQIKNFEQLFNLILQPQFKSFRKIALCQMLEEIGQFDLVVVYHLYNKDITSAQNIAQNAYNKYYKTKTGNSTQQVSAAYLHVLVRTLCGVTNPAEGEQILRDAIKLQNFYRYSDPVDPIWNDQLHFLLALMCTLNGNPIEGIRILFNFITTQNSIMSGEQGIKERIKAIKKIIDHIATFALSDQNHNTYCQSYRILARVYQAISDKKTTHPDKINSDIEFINACYLKAFKYNSTCPITHFEYGYWLLRQDAYETAFNQLQTALLNDDDEQQYGYAFRELTILPPFIRQLLSSNNAMGLQQEQPLEFWINTFKTYIYYKQNKLEEARNCLNHLREFATQEEIQRAVISNLEKKITHPRAAVDMTGMNQAEKFRKAEIHYTKAKTKMLREDYEQARTHFKNSLRFFSDIVKDNTNRGATRTATRKINKIETEYLPKCHPH